jgi:hypothetical protein
MLLRKPASIQDRGRKLWAHGNVDLRRRTEEANGEMMRTRPCLDCSRFLPGGRHEMLHETNRRDVPKPAGKEFSAASCRRVQAGSLCSPDSEIGEKKSENFLKCAVLEA